MKKFLCIVFCSLMLWGFNEDDMVNEALNAVDAKEYAKARDLYLSLYKENHKMEYFREAILVSSLINDPQATIDLVLAYQKKYKEYDLEIEKALADSYLRLGDVKNSITIVESIQKKESTPLVHEILGSLYLQSNRVNDALAEFNKAYDGDHSERSLEKIIAIYSKTQNNERIGDLLNTHLDKYGCSQELCKRSIEFYVKTKQISRVEKLLKRIEEKSPTIQNATNLIAVLAYEKKYDEAIEIAKKYPLNRSILLELYLGKNDFHSASLQAKKIYEESKNFEMLAISQIYFFESIKTNPTKEQILAMVDTLKFAIDRLKKEKQTPTSFGEYLNFLGYLMIDYDVDIKQGMEYVKEALAINPKNYEFIDSLAWGYYKMGDCKRAKEEFEKIPKAKVQEIDELKTHQKALLECNSR